MINNHVQQDVIRDLSKKLIAEIAPEELEIFDELFNEYPTSSHSPESGLDDALGFGVNALIVAATPAAKAAVTAVLSFVASEIVSNAKNESAVIIDQKIKALFNRGQNKTKEELPPLSKDTLNHIRKLAAKSARAQGLPEDQSQKIASALVGLLALV
jgi:hypothetical protein